MDEKNKMEEPSEELLWVWMTKLGRPRNKAVSLVYDIYGSPRRAWHAEKMTEEEINKTETPVFYSRVFDEKIKEEAKEDYRKTLDAGIRIIMKNSPLYPSNLANIFSAPPVIYVIGKLPAEVDPLMKLISVVGSRSCTAYGRNVTYRMCRELAECGIGIVSGLARGIDISAHLAALDAGGYTIAVMGGGVDVVYPPEHKRTYERIVQTGCIISEHPPGTEPLRNFFPARNRIIAGLSSATFVTEAGKSSGAMITVDRALEEGRDVLALPGNIDSPPSEGTNMLIRKGASCVTCVGDILEELSYGGTDRYESEGYCKGADPLDFLPDREKIVFKMILDGQSRPDVDGENSGLSAGEIAAALTKLELKGIIEKMPSGTWLAKKIFTS